MKTPAADSSRPGRKCVSIAIYIELWYFKGGAAEKRRAVSPLNIFGGTSCPPIFMERGADNDPLCYISGFDPDRHIGRCNHKPFSGKKEVTAQPPSKRLLL